MTWESSMTEPLSPSMQHSTSGTDAVPHVVAAAAADQHSTQAVSEPSPGAEPQSPPADAEGPQQHNKVLQFIANNMHYFTFAPLIIISSLQDVHLFLASVICTSISVVVLVVGFFLRSGGYIKMYPKPFDLFNLSLYASMIPLALCAYNWLLMYVGVYTNASNACFMWATIALPCVDNFVMSSVKDRVPERIWDKPDLLKMTCLISTTWAVALTIMTAGAAIPVAAKLHPTDPSPISVVSTYVLGFAPLLLAFPVQIWLTKHYKAKMMAQYQQHLQRQAQQQQQQQEGQQDAGAGAKDTVAAAGTTSAENKV